MATTDCPGCGLPRPADQHHTPCPVCVAGPAAPAAPKPRERATVQPHLPADAAELGSHAGAAPPGHRPHVLTALFAFALGVVVALAVQSAGTSPPPPPPPHDPPPPPAVAVAPPDDPAPPPKAAAAPPPVRPDPPAIPPTEADQPPPDDLAPPPRAVALPPVVPLDAPAVVLEINQPDHNVTFPPSYLTRPGQAAVLRGRLKTLTLYNLDNLSVDASGLDAEGVFLGASTAKASVVRVKAAKGRVTVSASVTDGTRMEVFAPDGEVNFTAASRPTVTGGAKVKVVARTVTFRGAIDGDGTEVDVTLADGGTLAAPALLGTARLEYRKTRPEDGPPRIDIPKVAPTAVLRRAD